ncbi:sulfite exporter TauE/SafE family protein [Streptomyces sp. NPDC014734]|uniref:sulfite exporter TauE/SafE family protein n=1 Tax=Streptomyces sp. NPDC014734 TaxID=3364886 RepID=UPI0036F5D120
MDWLTQTDAYTALVLALFGLAGGIGITAVGPGGVLPTIGMFLFAGLSPAGVAGTAIATHVATGLVGTTAYIRSGQLRDPGTRRTAMLLAATALVGTPVGVLLNHAVDGRGFGILLALAVAATAVLVWMRERRAGADDAASTHVGTARAAALGLAVSAAAGLFGLGGPMLSVPLLVVCGVPVLSALAAAQAQSVVIASVGTVGYVLTDAVDWPLVLIVGVPELAGVLIGWKIAHAVPARQLKTILVCTLLLLAPYLALHS